MKVHELINVLNHFPPGAEVVSPPEQVKADDGTVFSVSGTYATLKDGSGHSLAVKVAPPTDADGLRTDGPTLAEFVAAGYKAENYPPEGYAAKPSTTPGASGDASAAALTTIGEG